MIPDRATAQATTPLRLGFAWTGDRFTIVDSDGTARVIAVGKDSAATRTWPGGSSSSPLGQRRQGFLRPPVGQFVAPDPRNGGRAKRLELRVIHGTDLQGEIANQRKRW